MGRSRTGTAERDRADEFFRTSTRRATLRAPYSLSRCAVGGRRPPPPRNGTDVQNVKDGFKVNFPGQPTVTEATWKSQLNYTLPMRVYSAEKGRERYS